MTFGVGIQVREGIVALADTRIVRGSERVNKRKLSVISHAEDSLFAMTSGLRSVRDKALIYLNEHLETIDPPVERMYQLANLFGEQLRRVRKEDGKSLASSRLTFNTHTILGGCLAGDTSPQLFYIYPEGNWIEAANDSPYFIIGRTGYGKPILDQLLTYDTPLRSALALAILAFDATRMSVTDVDFPVDVAVLPNSERHATIHRFEQRDITEMTDSWYDTLRGALDAMPMEWTDNLFPQTNDTTPI